MKFRVHNASRLSAVGLSSEQLWTSVYMAWCIFILQSKSTVYIFLLINSCMKSVSWLFFSSCTIFWHPTSICPTGFLFCFLFCIIVSNVDKNWIFWSIQSVMGFGICGHRFRRSPFTNKIFYIYKSPESLLTPLVFCFELRLVAAGHAAVARAALRSSCRAVSSARFASLPGRRGTGALPCRRIEGSAARPPARRGDCKPAPSLGPFSLFLTVQLLSRVLFSVVEALFL